MFFGGQCSVGADKNIRQTDSCFQCQLKKVNIISADHSPHSADGAFITFQSWKLLLPRNDKLTKLIILLVTNGDRLALTAFLAFSLRTQRRKFRGKLNEHNQQLTSQL